MNHLLPKPQLRSWLTACAIALLLAACGGGGSSSDSSSATTVTSQGTVVDDQGIPLSGVTIKVIAASVGTASASSANDGTFSIPLSSSTAGVLRIEKAGFIPMVLAAGNATSNATFAARAVLLPVASTQTFDSTQAAVLRVPGSSARVELAASSLVRSDGQAISGSATVQLTPIDPSKDISHMPGVMVDANSGTPIESLGALSVNFTDASGAPLNLASGQTATIRIPATPAAGATLPATFPLYHLNETTGLWVQEGTATLQTDPATGDKYYEGTVSHFSTWNADQVITRSNLDIGFAMDGTACTLPAGARVVVRGVDYNGVSGAYGNNVVVRQNSQVQVLLLDSGGGTLDTVNLTSGEFSATVRVPRCLVEQPLVTLSGHVSVTSGSLTNYRVQISGDLLPTTTSAIDTNGNYAMRVPINRGTVQAKLVAALDRGTAETSVSVSVATANAQLPDLIVNDSRFELAGCVEGWDTFRQANAKVSLFKGRVAIATPLTVSSTSTQFRFSNAPLNSTLTLRVTAADSTLGETSSDVQVGATPISLSGCLRLPQAPVAMFQASGTGLTRNFDAGASTGGDANITNYTWDFGDGSTGEGLSVAHAYATPGTYTVGLQVKDSRGQVSQFTNAVTVTAGGGSVLGIMPNLISVSEQHACAVRAATVWCWGNNASGQLGNGTRTASLTAIAVPGLTDVASVGTGFAHTCALTNGGAVYCWGRNVMGELGIGNSADRLTPVLVTDINNAVAISLKDYRSCALTSDGVVACWGHGNFYPSGIQGTGDMASIGTGSIHACAVTTSGAAKCWGSNLDGQVGMGFSGLGPNYAYPVQGLSEGVGSVSSSQTYSCALLLDGGIQCWGRFPGLGGLTPAYSPVAISGVSSISAMSAGGSFVCTISSAGGAKCFGSNWYGELGNATLTASITPVDVSGLTSGVVAISAGASSACAITGNGSVKCWGNNEWGQLGNGNTASSTAPVNVAGFP